MQKFQETDDLESDILERYSRLNGNWYRNSWKESSKLDKVDPKYFNFDFIILWLMNMALFSSEFEEFSFDPKNGWFQWYLNIGYEEEIMIMKDILVNEKV